MIDKTDPTNRDTVPAILTPGEYVLNKEATQMFGPVVEQMNNAGLQHRAMKNMGGGIQNYNDGGYSFMKPTSKFRGALKDLEADSYSTLFANSEKKETPWKGVDITGMSIAEVLALVKPNGAFHKYNKDNFDKNTTAVGKYQFVGSTLRDLKKRGVFEKLGIDDDTLFNESTQDALAAYQAVHRIKDRTEGTMSSARKELRNEWEGFKKLEDNQLNDIINEISGEVGVTLVGTTPQVPTQTVSVAPITSIPPQMRNDTVVSPRPQMRPEDLPYQMIASPQAEPLAIEQAVMQASVPQVQGVPPSPSSFGEAFKDARADMGAGGIFTFRGNDYTTNYAEEEDKRMTANMGGAVHLNAGGMSIDRMARRKLQEDVDNAWFKRNERDALTKFDQANLALKKMPQKFAAPSPMQTDIDALPMALPSGGSQQEPGMPDLSGPRRVPPMSPPMPAVNSDASLLQGSSDSVDRAFKFKQLKHGVPKPGQGYGVEAFGSGNIYTNGQNAPVVKDPRKLGGSEGYGQTGDATSRRAAQQQRLIALRENLTPGSPEHIKVSNLITGSFTPSMTSLDELVDYNIPASMQDAGRMMANNVPMGDGVPKTAASSIPKPSINYSGISFDALVTLANDGDAKAQDELVQRNDQANLNDIAVDDRRRRGYEVLTETPIDPNRPQITGDLSPGVYSESQQLGIPIPQGVDFNYEGPESGVSSHTQALEVLKTPNLPKDDYVKANEALNTPDTVVTPVSPDTFDTRGEGTGRQKFAAASRVEGIINNLPEDDKKTSNDQDLAAKRAAAAEEARLNQAGGGDAKNTPEVKGAMSAIKSMFGDLFDTKELARAAILYLGGRATGLNGNQALAFAGKNYLARVDAKEGTYQKAALAGTYTKDSLAVYKKTMNPADLVAKDQPAIETGDYKDVYHTKSGAPVKLIEKETSTGRKLYFYEGKQVNLNDFTTDGRYSVGSKDHEIYVGQLESAVISQVKELQEINMTDSDSNGKGSKPIIGITPTGVATQAAKYVIKNQLPREVMRDLVSIAYQDAVAEKMSTGKTPSSLESFFERAYVKSRTSNVVNFTLGNGKPAPAASVNQFFGTIRDMATAAEQVENPEFKLSSLNDTQLSTWLLQSDTYTSWNQIQDPEEKKFFVDRGSNEVPPRSGFMQYVLEGYPK